MAVMHKMEDQCLKKGCVARHPNEYGESHENVEVFRGFMHLSELHTT